MGQAPCSHLKMETSQVRNALDIFLGQGGETVGIKISI